MVMVRPITLVSISMQQLEALAGVERVSELPAAEPEFMIMRSTPMMRLNLISLATSNQTTSPSYPLQVNGDIVNSNPSNGWIGLTGDLPGYSNGVYPTKKQTT